MHLPDWRNLALNDGVVPEPTPDNGRLVLWVPGDRGDVFQHWRRVSSVAHVEPTVRDGLSAVPAVAVPLRQPLRGFLGTLLSRFRKASGARSWVLPNGAAAEQCGDRQADLILVWASPESAGLDVEQVRAQWREGKTFQQIGKNLFLVSGIEPPAAPPEPGLLPPEGCPRPAAEQLLAAARQSGDRRREATALTDLGILHREEGDAQKAVPLLEEALRIMRELGDRAGEQDVLGPLGLATLAVGQPRPALQLLKQAHAYAQETGEPFALKASFGNLGYACAALHDHARAIGFYEQALALARQLGDRKHEAELLWYLAIQHAEIGQREQAIAQAEATVDFLRQAGKPQAAWFAHHLERYRRGETADVPDASAAPLGGSVVAGLGAGAAPSPPRSPGLLRMAFSAGKSMAQFLGSGFKTAPPTTWQQRLRTCAACEHHTGVRCRLCGCFTNVKARLAHEECPLQKWPA
jgi:tetratricopeptide (TPR) repeat protein